jgi:hypothetical protein
MTCSQWTISTPPHLLRRLMALSSHRLLALGRWFLRHRRRISSPLWRRRRLQKPLSYRLLRLAPCLVKSPKETGGKVLEIRLSVRQARSNVLCQEVRRGSHPTSRQLLRVVGRTQVLCLRLSWLVRRMRRIRRWVLRHLEIRLRPLRAHLSPLERGLARCSPPCDSLAHRKWSRVGRRKDTLLPCVFPLAHFIAAQAVGKSGLFLKLNPQRIKQLRPLPDCPSLTFKLYSLRKRYPSRRTSVACARFKKRSKLVRPKTTSSSGGRRRKLGQSGRWMKPLLPLWRRRRRRGRDASRRISRTLWRVRLYRPRDPLPPPSPARRRLLRRSNALNMIASLQVSPGLQTGPKHPIRDRVRMSRIGVVTTIVHAAHSADEGGILGRFLKQSRLPTVRVVLLYGLIVSNVHFLLVC